MKIHEESALNKIVRRIKSTKLKNLENIHEIKYRPEYSTSKSVKQVR